jgi:hypothetical protein
VTNVVPQIIFPLLQNRLLLAGASSCNVSGHLIINVRCGGTAAQDSPSEVNEGRYTPLPPTPCSLLILLDRQMNQKSRASAGKSKRIQKQFEASAGLGGGQDASNGNLIKWAVMKKLKVATKATVRKMNIP